MIMHFHLGECMTIKDQSIMYTECKLIKVYWFDLELINVNIYQVVQVQVKIVDN